MTDAPKPGDPAAPGAKAAEAKPGAARPRDTKAAEPRMGDPKAKPKIPEARPHVPQPGESKKPEPARAETLKPTERGTEVKGGDKPGDGITRIDGRPRGKLVEPSMEVVDALDADSLVIHLTSDLRPLGGAASYVDWRLCGRLSDLLLRGVITGGRGEKVLVPTHGRLKPVRIFVFGWGPQRSMMDGATDVLKGSLEVLERAKAGRVAIALPEPALRLVGLLDEHLVKPLGDRLVCIFAPDSLLGDQRKDTRPIPAPHTNPG